MKDLPDEKRIFIFTGPNGAGRKTVADLSGSTLDIRQVISYTTRKPRPTEKNGQHYHFITPAQFAKDKENNEFVEVLEYGGHWFGVKYADIHRMLESHRAVYLVLSRHGGEVLKEVFKDQVVRIFIYIDLDTLIARHHERGDSEEDIQQYIAHYDREMEYKSYCEHAFENTDLAHTVFDLTKILDHYLDRDLIDLD